jgi:hypothetical protein
MSLSIIMALNESNYAERHLAGWHTFIVTLSVIMANAVMPVVVAPYP